jgi:hypothetical protein
MEPDFKALAEAWVATDPRMNELDHDRREALASRLAEALSRRRDSHTPDDKDIGLVVNVDRDHFRSPGDGGTPRMSESAMQKLTELVQERIDQDTRER